MAVLARELATAVASRRWGPWWGISIALGGGACRMGTAKGTVKVVAAKVAAMGYRG